VELSDPDARLSVVLRPVRYQFADAADAADRNWLEIDGQCGQRRNLWAFAEPCLTTLEARSIGAWLRSVAARTVDPQPDIGGGTPALTFAEPNLAFSVAAYGDAGAVVRAHLSLECAPPWEQDRDIFAFHLAMALPSAALQRAADVWDHELTDFPERG